LKPSNEKTPVSLLLAIVEKMKKGTRKQEAMNKRKWGEGF